MGVDHAGMTEKHGMAARKEGMRRYGGYARFAMFCNTSPRARTLGVPFNTLLLNLSTLRTTTERLCGQENAHKRCTSTVPDDVRARAVNLESATVPEVARGLNPMPTAPSQTYVSLRFVRERQTFPSCEVCAELDKRGSEDGFSTFDLIGAP